MDGVKVPATIEEMADAMVSMDCVGGFHYRTDPTQLRQAALVQSWLTAARAEALAPLTEEDMGIFLIYPGGYRQSINAILASRLSRRLYPPSPSPVEVFDERSG